VLCVIGDLVEDVVVRLSQSIVPGSDSPAVIDRRLGGSAANVAVAAAAAGCATRFIGRVGDDLLGAQLVEQLEDAEVDARVQHGRGRTGSVVVLVEVDGERTMLPDRAASTQLRDVDASSVDGVTWLHVPAYSLCAEPIGTTTRALARHVRRRWGRISVDVSSVAVVRQFGVDAFADALRELQPDVVFANAPEAELVRALGLPLLVVKRGADPVELVHGDGRTEQVAVDAVDGVRDTTGAGDAFAGGYLVALLGGAETTQAAAAGAVAAATVLRANSVDPE